MKHSRSFRVLRGLVIACLALEVVYVLGANLFLSLGGMAKMFESTNSVNATFRRAWTLWPGHVTVRDLRVVFQDPNVQWSIDLPRGKVKLSLSELARRTFHASSVTGDGLVFRMRHRVPPESAGEPAVRTLPPIPEFATPAVFEASVPEAPITDAQYNLWTVHLEGVNVEVSEFWAQYVRYQGAGRAQGKFRLKPARTLWVGPATLDLEPGKVTIGGDPLSSGLSGRIACTVHFFDVRQPVGREVFRFISSDIRLRAAGVRVEAARVFLPEAAGLRLASVPGTLRVDARVDHGRFVEKSSLELSLPELDVATRELGVTTREVRLGARSLPGGRGEATLDIGGAAIERPNAEGEPLRVQGANARMTSSSVDTAGDWTLADGLFDVREFRVADARWLNGALGLEDFRMEGGALNGSGELHYGAGNLETRGRVVLDRLRARHGSVKSALHGVVTLDVSNLKWAERTFALNASFSGETAELRSQQVRVEGQGVRLEVRAESENARARGRFSGSLHKIRATNRGFSVEGAGRADVNLEALDLSNLSGQASARIALGPVVLRSLSKPGLDETGPRVIAQAERFELTSHFTSDRAGRVDGWLESKAKALSARIGGTRMRADPSLSLRVRALDQKRGTGDVHAELEVFRFVADDRGEGLECPWSSVPHAKVRADLKLDPARGNRGSLRADVEQARLVWGDFHANGSARLGAELEGVFSSSGVRRVSFEAEGREIELRSGSGITTGWEAKLPKFLVRGTLDGSQQGSGPVAVTADGMQARIGRTNIRGDLGSDLRLTRLDFDRGEGRILGKIELNHVRLRQGDEAVNDWWARVEIESGALTAGKNLDLSAWFRARLRDATPGIAVLTADGELPGWLGAALPLKELNVTGMVNRRCRLTDIRLTQVSGGPLLSRGRIQSMPDAVRGALLVRLTDLEAVSAGVRFGSKDSGVSMFAGDDWLSGQEDALDAMARRVVEGPCLAPPRECTK